jgi:transcriptional regulator with XRE-family HTH domain
MDVVATWTGELTHHLRVALRMTVEEFAQHLGVAPRTVANWEREPANAPLPRTQQLLDTALTRSPDDARARFAALRGRSSALRPSLTASDGAGPLPGSAGLDANEEVIVASDERVDWLEGCLRRYYQADNLLGPTVLLPVLRGHLVTIHAMRVAASTRLLTEVLRVGAAYAEFAGWLCQDAGRPTAAREHSTSALEWAEAAGDQRMAAFVLFRRAVQAATAGDGTYAVRLAQAAQRDTTPETARVRALAAQAQALGHALARDAEAAARALDAAERLTADAEDVPVEGDPSDGRYCELPLYLQISRAKVRLALGDGGGAACELAGVLEVLPAGYRRDRGQYLSKLAQACTMAGLPDEACSHATESLAIAREMGSRRTLGDLRAVVDNLSERGSRLREVDQLRDGITEALAS